MQLPCAAGGLQRRLGLPHSALVLPRQRERLSPGTERGRTAPALLELLEPLVRFLRPLLLVAESGSSAQLAQGRRHGTGRRLAHTLRSASATHVRGRGGLDTWLGDAHSVCARAQPAACRGAGGRGGAAGRPRRSPRWRPHDELGQRAALAARGAQPRHPGARRGPPARAVRARTARGAGAPCVLLIAARSPPRQQAQIGLHETPAHGVPGAAGGDRGGQVCGQPQGRAVPATRVRYAAGDPGGGKHAAAAAARRGAPGRLARAGALRAPERRRRPRAAQRRRRARSAAARAPGVCSIVLGVRRQCHLVSDSLLPSSIVCA